MQIVQRMIAQPFLIRKLKSNMLSIKFFIRKRKTSIVYFIVKVNGRAMRERSTGITVLPEHWDERSQTVIGNDSENETISIIKSGIRSTYNKLLKVGEVPSPQYLMRMYLANYHQVGIHEICQKYLAHKNNKQLAKSTIKNYTGWVKNLKKYLLKIHNTEDIPISHFKLAIAEDFFDYLRKKNASQEKENTISSSQRKEKAVCHNLAVAHVGFIVAAMNYAIDILEIIKDKPFSRFTKRRIEKSSHNHITHSELQRIENTEFSCPKMQLAADIYKFQCYTGLSYVDVHQFDRSKHLYFDL